MALLIALGVLFAVLQIRKPPEASRSIPADPVALSHADKSATPKSPAVELNEVTIPATRRTNLTGKLRVGIGETALLSFWELEPGINGMLLMSPSITEEGHFILGLRQLEIPDAAFGVDPALSPDLLPDIFGNERRIVISAQRRDELVAAMEANDAATIIAHPRIYLAEGKEFGFGNYVSHPDWPDDTWFGTKLAGQIEALPDGTGFDVEFDLDRRDTDD